MRLKITKMMVLGLVFLLGKIVIAQDRTEKEQNNGEDYDTLYQNAPYNPRLLSRSPVDSRCLTLTKNPTSGVNEQEDPPFCLEKYSEMVSKMRAKL